MPSFDNWLRKLAHLNVYKAKHGLAPHKPLLILVLLEMAERGELPSELLPLTPELSFKFDSYWHVVAHRRTQPPDVRMPFHHLSTDGLWVPITDSGERSNHSQFTRRARLDSGFVEAASDPGFRDQARRILIAKHFEPAERNALYHLVGMSIPNDDEIARDAKFEIPEDAAQAGREARFRIEVVAAYNYACALTGYRVTTIGLGTIVDAAHIHQFADSRNNDPRNGLALCKNAHWLFDNGLWTIANDYTVRVAHGRFDEESPDQKALTQYHGLMIRLPNDPSLRPSPEHLTWHKTKKFQGS